ARFTTRVVGALRILETSLFQPPSAVGHGSTPQLLVRGTGFLILDLQIIHHLLNVGHGRRHRLGSRALVLRVHFSGERDYAALHRVFHVVVHVVLDQRGVVVLFNPVVEVRVHGLCFALGAHRNYGNLIRHNLSARQ